MCFRLNRVCYSQTISSREYVRVCACVIERGVCVCVCVCVCACAPVCKWPNRGMLTTDHIIAPPKPQSRQLVSHV